jgi:hypothetical protein
MKCRKRSFAVVSVLFTLLLSFMSFGTGTLSARDADPDFVVLAAAHPANAHCLNTCRARYHDCRSLNQIPVFQCRGIYHDCTRYTCGASPANRPSWSGFPR